MDLYAENILEHFKHPHGKSLLPSPTAEHEEINVSCGDRIRVQLLITDDSIAGIGWDGTGCAVSQAAMSILRDELIGKPVSAIDTLSADAVRTLLGVPISTRRAKCAFLSLHALKNLLHRHRGEPEQSWPETVAEGSSDKYTPSPQD